MMLKMLIVPPSLQTSILIKWQWRRQEGARGRPPPITKKFCSRNAQICNKIDALEGSFEIASATALFHPEKGVSLFPKRRFPDI